MSWSLERKLPLFVTILLVAVAITQLTIGYGEVRQASRALADKRLPLATKVLADLFQTGQGRVRITTLAKDPAIAAFLRSGGRSGREAALAAMRRVTTDTASNAGLELRDFTSSIAPDAAPFLREAAGATLQAHLDKLADEGRLPEGVR